MRLLASFEVGRTDEILAWLKQEQIPVEVRTIRQQNGSETSEILVEEESFGRGRAVVEEWYAEQGRLRENQFWMRVVSALLILSFVLSLFRLILGLLGLSLLLDWAFFYVAWKAVRTGTIHARPLAEWSDDVERFKNPFRFWLLVFLCIMMGSFILCLFIFGVTKI